MKENLRYWGWSSVSLLFMIGFKFLPTVGEITPIGMEVIGIFIGMIIAFCTVGMIWPSILALILLGLVEENSVTIILKEAFGHSVVIYMFALLMIGYMLEQTGITQIFAQWLVSRPLAKKRPWVLSTFILLAGYSCALFIGMIAPALICWTIICNICTQVGYRKGDKWPTYMIFTTMFLCTVASFVFPFQLGVVSNFGILNQASGGEIVNEFVPYLAFTTILCSIIFVVCILYGKYIYRPNMQLLLNQDTQSVKIKFNRKQKCTMIFFVIFILGLFLPSILPDGILKSIMTNLGNTGWSVLIIAIGAIIRIDKEALLDFNLLAEKGVIWDVILMMAAIFTMSAALTNSNTGFSQFVLQTLDPLLDGCGQIIFIVLFLIITIVLTNLINNIAVCAVLIPIAYTLSGGINVDILALVTLMNVVGNLGFLLPSSSSQAAMIFNHEWVNIIEARKIAIFEMFIVLVLDLLFIPIANLIIG